MDATLQVRIDSDLKDRLAAIQEKHGIPMSELTRRAIADLVEKMERAKTPLPAKE